MNEQAASILKTLVARYGTSVALDPLRCEGLLRDTCPRCNREIFVLVNAIRQQVTADLLAPRHSLPPSLFRGFLVKRLQDELGFSDEAAQWAVGTWADALGLENGTGNGTGTREPEAAPAAGSRQVGVRFPEDSSSSAGRDRRAEWARELESGSMDARLETIRQISGSQDKESFRLLITGLENFSWRVREAAFDALLDAGGPAVPTLVEALADSHERVVVPAIILLGTLKARDAVAPLLAVLDDGGEPAANAVWALGEIGDERAITPLTRLLNSGDARLRAGAEQALRKFG